jgi:hypothetical protein
MPNNTHTPGPWTVMCTATKYGFAYKIDEMEAEYETAEGSGDDSVMENANERNEANARLIAAAPEMLEALETAKLDMYAAWVLAKDLGDKPSIDHCSKSLSRVSNAIAKAKGL